MRKVLFVHDGPIYQSADSNYYGVDYNTDLKNRYLYLGESVTFLMRVKQKKDNDLLSPIEGSGFNVVAVPDFKKIPQYFSNKKKASEKIKNEVLKHDVIIIRLPSSIGIEAYKNAKKYKKPFIIELVACAWDGYINHSSMGKLIAPYMFCKIKNIVRNSPYVMYVSNQFLQRRYPTKGKPLSCSDVALSEINDSVLPQRLDRIKQAKERQRYMLGTVGAVNMKYKGQQYVVKALRALKNEGYQMEYYLVGGGDNSYLKQLAKILGVEDSVKFIGTLSHEEVFDFIKEIDVYIQPSNVESHGRVIIEAMSVACPVIGSSTGGIPELVDDKYVFQRKNVKNLVAKIKNMIRNDLESSAKSNFRKASDFCKNTLDEKRNKYYDDFLKQVGDYND